MPSKRTPLTTLSQEKLEEILGNQSSEQNIRELARYSFDRGSRMGVSFITAEAIIFAVGKIEAVSDEGFVLRDETETWEIRYNQVIKVYAVPN